MDGQMKTIVKMKFGSHLYGTDTPESDTDYKGIILPSKQDCVLNRIPKSINATTGQNNSKNTKDDIDEEYYSLQYFMKLAANGEMIIIDMLHAPDNMLIESNGIWRSLQSNRSKFYTKNLAGYMGYIKKQTAKYGVKGSRLAAMKQVIELLKTVDDSNTMKEVWNRLPINDYCNFTFAKDNTIQMYEVCGKKFGETIKTGYMRGIVTLMYSKYGDRARAAEANEGIDWKAVSHAYRASEQLIEIYKTGDLRFPLEKAELITDMKVGKLHYKNDNVQQLLELNLEQVQTLAKLSDYPEEFDRKWADNFILKLY